MKYGPETYITRGSAKSSSVDVGVEIVSMPKYHVGVEIVSMPREPASQPASQAGVEYEFLHGVGVEYATYNLPRRWR